MGQQNNAYSAGDKLARTRYYMGGYWTFLATGEETGGKFSLIEMNIRRGLEPPRHTHTFEDESFSVVEGDLDFFAGEDTYHVPAGGFIHLPRGIPHHFRLRSNTAKLLTYLNPPGLEEMFLQMSEPANILDFPALPPGPPPAEWLQKIRQLQEKYGIVNIDNTKIKAS